MRKFTLFIVMLSVSIMATLIGTYFIPPSDIVSTTQQEINQIYSMDYFNKVLSILENNFLIALGMFVPALGVPFGIYVLWNTGYILAGLSSNPQLDLLSLFLLPHSWLEYFSYSIAMTNSIYLIYAMRKGFFKREIKHYSLSILLVFALLTLGAMIEAYIISVF